MEHIRLIYLKIRFGGISMIENMAYFFSGLFFVSVIGSVIYLRFNNRNRNQLKEQLSTLQTQLDLMMNQKRMEEEKLNILMNTNQPQNQQMVQQPKPHQPHTTSEGVHVVEISDGFETTIQLLPGQEDYNVNVKL